MNLTELSIRKPVFAWMLMAAFIFFGGIAAYNMGVSQLPDVDFPIVNINVTWEGAAPEVMELDVVDTIENAVISVEGVKNISSTARRGSANITIEFDLKKDIDVAVQEVQTKLGQAQRQLPDDIDPPIVSKSNPEDRPIMWIAITNQQLSRRDLMTYVRDQVKDKFLAIPGVSDVTLGGYIDPNLRVWVDNKKLNQYQLTALDVTSAISQEHVELPGGLYEEGNTEFSVRTLGEALTIKDFEKLIINKRGGTPVYTPIKMTDVARIDDDLADVRRISRVNGGPAIGLGIRKIRGANSVDIADRARELIPQIRSVLPAGSEIGVNFDSTTFIKASIEELYYTLFHAALLTSLVCWLFLGSLGATFNIILSIPSAIIGTFLGLKYLGYTLNNFTLLGLTLAVGMVVDDNIMVLENISRYFKMGKDKLLAALEGTKEISFAAMASAIAIIAIFLPIGFADGIVGRYLEQFAFTICIAISFSLLDALTLTPMRASLMMTANSKMDGIKIIHKLMMWMERFYGNTLDWAIRMRWVLVPSALLGSILVSFFFVTRVLPIELSPAQDQSQLMLMIKAPTGSSLAYTNGKTADVEKLLMTIPDVQRYFGMVGGFGGNEADSAYIFVTLKDQKDRSKKANGKLKTQDDLATILREKLKEVKGVRVMVIDQSRGSIGGGHSRGYPVEFNIQGGSWDVLLETSKKMIAAMEESKLMVDADTNYKGKIPEIHITPDRNQALLHGVSVQELGKMVQILVSGSVSGKFSKNGRRYDIRVKLEEDQLKNIKNIESMLLRNNRGELIPLSKVAKIERKEGLQLISRENRLRSVSIYANIAPNSSQGEAIAKTKLLAKKILPEGYTLSETGSAKTLSETMTSLIYVFILGVIVAYMVLAAQFNSFIQPIIILTALPTSILGALIALYLGGLTLNIYSMIGIILLMGIVKKNSILLVDFTNHYRNQGMPIVEALKKACPVRLRPIIMTSAATIAGAVPAAISSGTGAETRIPMAIAVIGGSLLSTLLTLYVVPGFYLLPEDIKNIFKKKSA